MEKDRLERATVFIGKRTPAGGEKHCCITLEKSATKEGCWGVLFCHDASTELSRYETTDPVVVDVTYGEAVKEFVRVLEMELKDLQPQKGGE